MADHIERISQAILNGDQDEAAEVAQAALRDGADAGALLNQGLIPAMDEVGRLFEAGEYFVPEMLIAARAMQAALDILRPQLVEADVQPLGTMVVGTVQGDLHDIGKNLVAMMVEGAGFEIVDLGTDVAPEAFVEAVRENNATLVGLSALLTTTLPNMQNTINAIEEAGLRDRVKIMIGGAPTTPEYAQQIGADGHAADASRAAALAKTLTA